MPDQRTMRDQLMECVDDMEAIVMQLTDRIVIGKQPETSTQESLCSLSELFHQKYEECQKLIEEVPEHQEREEEIRKLDERVRKRDDIIAKLAEELKFSETTLQQATYEAQKKLRAIRQSETNRVHSEEVVRLAHQLSKSYSVLSPNDWQQGDPSRPFPTEAAFSVSQLMRSQIAGFSGAGPSSSGLSSQPGPSSSSASQLGAFPLRPQISSSSGPSPAGGVVSRTASNSALRSSPMASAGMPFPSGSQQSQKPSGFTSGASGMFNSGNIVPTSDGNSPRGRPSGNQPGGPSPSSRPVTCPVEQMTSDSSSSSSSGDEASRDK